jgi:hypothetical protein
MGTGVAGMFGFQGQTSKRKPKESETESGVTFIFRGWKEEKRI